MDGYSEVEIMRVRSMSSLYNRNLKDMTLLAGFQPLSIAKINILYHKPGFYGQIYYGVNFKSSPV